jgi:hypothetical protein
MVQSQQTRSLTTRTIGKAAASEGFENNRQRFGDN